MRRSIATFAIAAVPLVLACLLSTYVFAQRSTREYANQAKAISERVAQIDARIQLLLQDIARRPDAGRSHNELFKKLNDGVADLAVQADKVYQITQEMLDNDVFLDDGVLTQDIIGMRQQLDHLVRDIENTLQYMEHLNYQMSRSSPNI